MRRGYKPGSSRIPGRVAGSMKRFAPAMARAGLKRTAYGAAALGVAAVGRGLYKRFSKKSKSIHQKAKPNIPGQGSGGTFSTFYSKSAIKKFLIPLKKTGAPNFSYVNNPGRLTSAIGFQGVAQTSSIWSAADMAALIYSSTTIGRTQRMLLESCTSSTIYRNQSNNDAYLTLYDVVSRRDINTADANKDPVVCWYNGLTDTGISGTLMQVQVGNTPFSSPKFCQFYKVLRVTHIILPAGGTHDHRVNISPMRLVNNEIWQDSYNARNLSYFTIAAFNGAPDNDVTTKTNVTTGSVAIDYVQTKQYRYTYLQDSTTANYYNSTLPTTGITETIEQDESGLVSAVTAA